MVRARRICGGIWDGLRETGAASSGVMRSLQYKIAQCLLSVACIRLQSETRSSSASTTVPSVGWAVRGSTRIVEGDPAPSVLVTSTNLWPGQSTAHSAFLEPLSSSTRAERHSGLLARCTRGNFTSSSHRITGPGRGSSNGVWQNGHPLRVQCAWAGGSTRKPSAR